MQLLCAITDWEKRTAERGKAAGNQITSRMVVAGDNWNYVYGLQSGTEAANIIGQAFYTSIRILLWAIAYRLDIVNRKGAAQRVVDAINARAKTKFQLPEDPAQWEAFGKRIDDQLGTSYGRSYPPKVMKTFFGANEVEE